MSAYYNEIEPYAAQWLRNLIAAGLIASGEVDERPIQEVSADDLKSFTQWHLLAGIAGWSAALRLAEWPDERPVLTVSVPCQPFSAAGKRGGHADKRNLWPHALRLIGELCPPTIFGEQVAAALGYGWLDGVLHDLERVGYAVAAVDLPACSVGAPHIRQRLFWMGDAGITKRCSGPNLHVQPRRSQQTASYARRTSPWTDIVWALCLNGKARRTQSGLQPLVDGVPFRLADGRGPVAQGVKRKPLLAGIGNAIVPPLAAEFVRAYLESRE